MTKMILATALVASALVAAGAAPSNPAASPLKKDLERAYQMKEGGRVPEALAAFGAVLKKDPNNIAALSEVGYLHMGLKQYAAAARSFEAASLQEPGNTRLRMDLGYAYQSLKRAPQARAQFAFVASVPGELQEQAREALREMAAPGRQAGLRSEGYAALKRGDQAGARKAFVAALAQDRDDALALKQLGFIDLAEGRLEAAAEGFERLRTLTPDDHFVALQLGYTYDRMKKSELARQAYGAALASTDMKVVDAARAALKAASAPPAAASPL